MSELGAAETSINAGAFMAQAASEGLGVVEARNALRAGGMRMSNATFSRMYGEIRTAVGERDALQQMDYGAVPSGEMFTDWAAGAEGGYATFTTSYVRRPGSSEVEPRYYIFTSDEPHSPQEAIDAAAAFFTTEGAAGASVYDSIYQGSIVTSVTRTVGGG